MDQCDLITKQQDQGPGSSSVRVCHAVLYVSEACQVLSMAERDKMIENLAVAYSRVRFVGIAFGDTDFGVDVVRPGAYV